MFEFTSKDVDVCSVLLIIFQVTSPAKSECLVMTLWIQPLPDMLHVDFCDSIDILRVKYSHSHSSLANSRGFPFVKQELSII